MHIRPVLYIIDLDEFCLTVKNIQILIQNISRWAAPKRSAQSSFRKGSIIRNCLRQFWEFRESSRLKVWDLDSPNSLAFWLLIVEKIDFIETLLRWFTTIRPRFYSLTLSHSICLLVTENTSMTFALSTETKAQHILDKNWTQNKISQQKRLKWIFLYCDNDRTRSDRFDVWLTTLQTSTSSLLLTNDSKFKEWILLVVWVYISYVRLQISDSNGLQMSGFTREMEEQIRTNCAKLGGSLTAS